VANEERRQERILYRGRRRRENATRFGKLRLPAHAEVATAAHLSVSAFVLRAAAQEAESVLAERPLLSLSAEAAEAFSDALERPGRVNKRLADALGRRRKFGWWLTTAAPNSSTPPDTTVPPSSAARRASTTGSSATRARAVEPTPPPPG
jgi:uncharacterized protein (DUF1778 family)